MRPLVGVVPELADELAELTFLNEAILWRIARSTLPKEEYNKLDELLARQGQGKIAATEQQTLDQLVEQSQYLTLTRGQAALLLKQRGYDLSNPEILSPASVTVTLFRDCHLDFCHRFIHCMSQRGRDTR